VIGGDLIMTLPNLTEYADKKANGWITIQKIDANDFAIGTKRFDPNSGVELPQEVLGVNLAEVDKKIAELQAQIDELTAFKTDLQAVK
jgi:hypothetical protein